MEMHNIELTDGQAQLHREIGRIVEPSEPTRTTIVDLNAIEINRSIVWHIAIIRTVHTSSKDMNPMADRGERLAQGMNGIYGTAIANGRKIRGNDVQDLHNRISEFL